MRNLPAALRLLIALTYVSLCSAATRYETRVDHDPDGTGKFYMGREIAHVMGPDGISWLERPEREAEESSQKLLAALQIAPGQTVVDLGAGSGYYSFKMAQLVGASGKVLAADVQPAMLAVIDERAAKDGIENVTTIRSDVDDPHLPTASVDLLLMVDVYHELEFPFEVMQHVRKALKPNGRVALVEFRQEDPRVMIKEVHKMSEKQVIAEMMAAGFKHLRTVTTLPIQHLVIFTKDR
jgi:predicted methyltransferase